MAKKPRPGRRKRFFRRSLPDTKGQDDAGCPAHQSYRTALPAAPCRTAKSTAGFLASRMPLPAYTGQKRQRARRISRKTRRALPPPLSPDFIPRFRSSRKSVTRSPRSRKCNYAAPRPCLCSGLPLLWTALHCLCSALSCLCSVPSGPTSLPVDGCMCCGRHRPAKAMSGRAPRVRSP